MTNACRTIPCLLTIMAFLAMSVACVASGFAQQAPAQTQADEEPEESSQSTTSDDEQPQSLDELLGLDEDEQTQSAEDAARRARDEQLQRKLSELSESSAFEQAMNKMSLSAELLDNEFDTGLGTQRVQKQILEKLDELIEMADNQPNQQGSPSSSSSNSEQQQQQQQQPGKQQRQQNQQTTKGGDRTGSGDVENVLPPGQDPEDVNTVIEETRTEWGNLPQRVRNMLLQGRREKFSSLYEQLTREYYKRLAEEGSDE